MDAAGAIKLLNIIALAALMISIGMTIKVQQVAESFKNVWSVAISVSVNFAIVPFATVALLTAFQPDPLVSAGFVILAVCPGAPLGPAFTRLAQGDELMSTGQMVLLAGLSAVLTPALFGFFLGLTAPHSEVTPPYFPILVTLLLSQLLPLALGFAIHHWAPELTKRTVKSVRSIANVLLVALITLILIDQYETLAAIRGRAWLEMAALSLASLAIGWVSGGTDPAKRKAAALTTATRNVAVGLVIAVGCFSGTPAVTAVIAYGLFSTLIALICAILFNKFAPPLPRETVRPL